MKLKKQLLCIVLMLCYVAGNIFTPVILIAGASEDEVISSSSASLGASHVTDFLDIKESDWFYVYLESLVTDGVINGKSKTQFDPDGTFSFAECSAVITRYLGLDAYAKEKQNEIINAKTADSSLWYCGYLQVMHELGIFDEQSGLYSVNEQGLVFNISNQACSTPIKRHEFACAIAKSFELDGSLRSKNIYSEISGLGHDFIIGGHYMNDYLGKYTDLINDYHTIVDASKEYVLKLYYNGIFLGDEQGFFNPENNLKRSEMAKVLATIRDFSLRKSLITDYCPKPQNSDFISDANGEEYLNYKYCLDTLQKCAAGFNASGNVLKYVPNYPLPYGYAVDVYLYSMQDNISKPVMKYTLSESDVQGNGFVYDMNGSESLRAIMVLRNLQENARSEFTLNVSISHDGIVTKSLIC